MEAFKHIGIKKSLRFILFQFISLILNITFIPQLRVLILRLLGSKIGRNSVVYKVSFMNLYRGSFKNLIIGNNCFIGNDVLLDLAGKITLEDDVTISDKSILITHNNVGYKSHPLQKVFPSFVSQIVIKYGVFVGVGSIILPSITINKLSLIGAGSVVTKDIGTKKLAFGVPCKEYKKINI